MWMELVPMSMAASRMRILADAQKPERVAACDGERVTIWISAARARAASSYHAFQAVPFAPRSSKRRARSGEAPAPGADGRQPRRPPGARPPRAASAETPPHRRRRPRRREGRGKAAKKVGRNMRLPDAGARARAGAGSDVGHGCAAAGGAETETAPDDRGARSGRRRPKRPRRRRLPARRIRPPAGASTWPRCCAATSTRRASG